ncbi:acyl-CoA carboxylase epsilon subunit [Streptomyces sp. NPDC002073]
MSIVRSIAEERTPESAHAPDAEPGTRHPGRGQAAGGQAGVDDTSALALAASIRITKGNPTAEEVATLAVLLGARIRLQHQERAAQPGLQASRLPRRIPPAFIPPGSWAS